MDLFATGWSVFQWNDVFDEGAYIGFIGGPLDVLHRGGVGVIGPLVHVPGASILQAPQVYVFVAVSCS